MTVFLSCDSNFPVDALSGEVVGTTSRLETLPTAGARRTAATPGVDCNVETRRSRTGASAADSVSATTWNGPLKPGPNPCASRSYATLVVDDAGSFPWSDEPSL